MMTEEFRKLAATISLVSQVVVVVTAVVGLVGWGTGIIADQFRVAIGEYVDAIHEAAPQVEIVRTSIVVHTSGQSSPGWSDMPRFVMSNEPQPEQNYVLDLDCPQGYAPAAGWHETTGSYPSDDVLYTVDIGTTASSVTLRTRARRNRDGYAYVDVLVLCRHVSGSGATE